ncbi:hypothetical protein [Rhodococcus koreensis]|uniref:hypothetical protein n=1 Tax=Rhodococcus koreensis TaxID=99653 RepID=UPI0030844F52
MTAEQHDEWIDGRRCLGLDVLARSRGDNAATTEPKQEVTPEAHRITPRGVTRHLVHHVLGLDHTELSGDSGGPAPTTRWCVTSVTSPVAPTPHTCGWGPTPSTAPNATYARRNLASPLADVRGPAGRTRAIAAAIRTGLACGEATDRIEERIRCAEAAGLPLTLW